MTSEQNISYTQLFPWLHLFRAIGLAASFGSLVVALGACGIVGTGLLAIDALCRPTAEIDTTSTDRATTSMAPVVNIKMQVTEFPYFAPTPDRAADAIKPWGDVVGPMLNVFDREQSAGQQLANLARFFWSVATWSSFGLILCRLTARRIARDDDSSLRKSSRFGATRWLSAIVSPSLPLAAATLLLVAAIMCALPGRIPGVGPSIVVMASPFIVGCSLIATLLLMATLIGWPLMIAAIAYEDCDGFGGLSRSYSMWTGRPWHFVGYWIVVAVAGTLSMFLVGVIGASTVHVAEFVYRSGMGANREVLRLCQASGNFVVNLCVSVYGVSYFWTSSTIIYGLLRTSVDHVPMSVVSPDDEERPARELLPVVGMPAMEPRAE